MATPTEIRAQLQRLAAGETPRARGHAIERIDLEMTAVIAKALRRLFSDRDAERVHAPPEALPPLP